MFYILDRYIIRELMGPFLFGVCAFSIVFIGGGTLWRIAQYLSKYGASGDVVLKLFVYSLPGVIVVTFPMAMLLASLLCFGRLSSSGELTAMVAGGRSFSRLALPVFLVALCVSFFATIFKDTVVPASTAAYNYLVRYEIEGNAKPKSQDHVVILENTNGVVRLIYSPRFDATSNRMRSVTVQEFEDGRLVRLEQATDAVWQDNRWVMHSGLIQDFDKAGHRSLYFDQQLMPMAVLPSADIPLDQKKPEEMTIRELKLQISSLQSKKIATGTYEIEFHQRLTIPMACLVFTLIGAPLGLSPQRSSSSGGLGISIIIIFFYYSIMTYTTALAQSEALPAVVAAWIPNIVCSAAAIYLIHRI
jgi:lipopolysaccharide export system permease protein